MASIGETKKLVAGVAKQMGQLGGRLDKAKGNFENAKKHADKVLAGSATSIEGEDRGREGRRRLRHLRVQHALIRRRTSHG